MCVHAYACLISELEKNLSAAMESFHIPAGSQPTPRILKRRSWIQGGSNCLTALSRPASVFYYLKIKCAKKKHWISWSKSHVPLLKWTMDTVPQNMKWVLTSLHQPGESMWGYLCVCICVCLHKGAVEEDGESPEQQGIILWKGEHQCGATATSQVEHPPTKGPLCAK